MIKKIVGIINVVIPLIASVIVIAGGPLGYYYIDRFYVQRSKSETNLLDIKRKLGEMDLRLKGVRDDLGIVGKKIQVSGGIAQVIDDLRPKLNIEAYPLFRPNEKKTRLNFTITNPGKYSISVGELNIILSTEVIRSTDATAKILSLGVDYSLATGLGSLDIAHGQTVERFLDIEILKDKFRGCTLYFYGGFDVETKPEIVEALSGLLSDFLTADELRGLVRAYCRFVGEFHSETKN